jgi:hypothetical protein
MNLLSEIKKRKVRLNLFTISLLTIFSFPIHAQYNLSIETNYVMGFNTHNIGLQHLEVSENLAHGYQLMTVNSLRFKKTEVEPTIKIGMKYLRTSGSMVDLSYKTDTYKFAMAIGTRYHIDSTFTIGAFLGFENNLDFDYFRTQTSDLFRYSIQSEFQYKISRKWDAILIYDYAFLPTSDHYFFTNPQHQIKIGFIYRIL